MNDTMNISHGLPGGIGRIEDAYGESPAASLGWVLPCMKFILFVHYSLIIRSLCKQMYPRAMLRLLGTILGSLGGSWGAPGGSWKLLKRSWGELTLQRGGAQTSLAYLDRFLDPSWAPKGGQDGAQDDQKTIKKISLKTIAF